MREGMSKLGGCFKIQTHSQKFWVCVSLQNWKLNLKKKLISLNKSKNTSFDMNAFKCWHFIDKLEVHGWSLLKNI
jgi:hypothetical protein